MGRKKQESLTALVPDAPLDEQALQATQSLGAIAQGLADERDLGNQLLGQAQMADAFAKFSVTVTSSKLAYVKENKLYRALAGKQSGNGYQCQGTWEEFCGLLGMSREKADQDIANLRSFGEEALESMSRMGIGYREMRQYRRLPEDDKSALIEAAKCGDSAAFVDLAEELISKHVKEKEALNEQLADAKADYEALGDITAKKTAEMDGLRLDLIKATSRIKKLNAPERSKELCAEAARVVCEFDLSIQGTLRTAFAELATDAEVSGVDHRYFKSLMIRQLEKTLSAIRAEYSLPDVDEAQEFGWLEHLGSSTAPDPAREH